MLEQVFEALREPVIVFDASGHPCRINRAAFELVGLPPGPVSTAEIFTLLEKFNARTPDGTLASLKELPSRLVLGGAPEARTTLILTRAGVGDVHLEVCATPVMDGSTLCAVVVVLRDTSEARRAEAQLRRGIRMLRAHSHVDSAALHISDEAGYLSEVCRILVEDCQYPMAWVGIAENDEARSVRPVAHAGFEAGYLQDVNVSWADTERGRGPTGRAIRTGRAIECPDMLTDPAFAPWREQAGRRGYAASVALPLSAGEGVFGALTIYFTQRGPLPSDEIGLLEDLARDIGDGVRVLRLRKAEAQARDALRRQAEELERADRIKDEFLATLSHELRTPLSTILVWAHLLLTADLDDEASLRAREAILRNAEAQRSLINDILDLSRIVGGNLRLEIQRVVLADVLAAAVEVVRPAADAKRLRLDVECLVNGVVAGDPGRLQQVIWNLLSNAVKFTPEGGGVHVVLDRAGSHVRLAISDTGIGISPSFLPHVFERFTQQDASASREHGGLGLGLAIARHLVELHGGTIVARSEGPGRGATFTVTLSERLEERTAADAAADAAEHGPQPAPRLGLAGTRVLAVDDDADTRDLLAAVLEGLGADVVVTSSAEKALDALQASRFDILLADIGMPGTDGYALIQAVRLLPGELGRIPAIAVTAFGRQQDRARALAAGYQAHLAKPVLPDQLAAAIAWFTAQRR